jgi:hypothetical protein
VDKTYSVGSIRWSQPQSLDKCERVQNPASDLRKLSLSAKKEQFTELLCAENLTKHCELTEEAVYMPLPFSVFSKVFSKTC